MPRREMKPEKKKEVMEKTFAERQRERFLNRPAALRDILALESEIRKLQGENAGLKARFAVLIELLESKPLPASGETLLQPGGFRDAFNARIEAARKELAERAKAEEPKVQEDPGEEKGVPGPMVTGSPRQNEADPVEPEGTGTVGEINPLARREN